MKNIDESRKVGTLYIVSTPIGNLEDITIRAIRTLQEVDIIACEDTRRTKQLFKHFSSLNNKLVYYTQPRREPRFISYYEQNELERIPELIESLSNGQTVALVSDAGTPLISDPGYKLIDACIKKNIRLESVPGASSILTALVSSGLPPNKFLFLGYTPKTSFKRRSLFMNLHTCFEAFKEIQSTVIFFEAPHRLIKTLLDIQEVFGNIHIVIARELTKKFEEVLRGSVAELIEHFKVYSPKGEFVLLLRLK